jgi:hypothetical protein
MGVDEFLDCGLELGDAAECPTPNLLHRELGEPAFHEAQPRAVGGGEVLVKARAFREPVSDQRRLVCAVVVHDDVDVESLRDARVDQIEKLSKLCRAVPLMELRDDLTRLRIERREQRRGAVAFVVMRPALHLSGLHRQQRLRAVEGLDLRFLVDAEHGRMRGGIQIQADDIAGPSRPTAGRWTT